ncbi:MAG: response regulator [Thermodesulfovibrionales bacterium]|nr:response regulator [Thermodesulfovibrionales bacterium]
MSYDTSGLLEFFLQEAEEHIHNLEEGISGLEQDVDTSSIESLFRSAHTLKGAAALVKLNGISRIAHRMEDILEEIKDGKRKVTSSIRDLLLYGLDAIKNEVRRISSGEKETPGRDEEIIKYIEASLKSSEEKTVETSGSEVEPVNTIKDRALEPPTLQHEIITPAAEKRLSIGRRKEDIDLFTGNFVRVHIAQIENILNLIGEITIKKNYLLQKIKKKSDLSEEITIAGARLLKEVNSFSERYSYSLPGSVRYVDPLLAEFGELEFDRYDDLNLFSRKLQEMIADITEALKSLSEFFDEFGDDLKSVDNLIKLLRTEISEMRMIEIGRLFQRFSRPVKEMAEQYGKEVELLINGGDTKIDKVIFERLFDPLMHLIRNAIIHGIERPEERRQKGKKATGVIMLSARREGALVLVEVHDNGRGIPTYRIFEEAVKLGLMRPDYRPSKQELLSLIFMPGFTTSTAADMGSGRGMGLDAVRNLIAQISGSIEVDSEVGMGTTFTIKVPTSLAITNVIVVKAGNTEFAIPMNFVDEVTEIDLEDGLRLFNYRGVEIEIKRLSNVLGLVDERSEKKPLIICNLTDRRAGLVVDEIAGQEETIIKPMNKFLSGLSVYSGSTISGDGKLRFVLNPLGIFRSEIKTALVLEEKQKEDSKTVLVVDDSLSVRKYLTAFFERMKLKVLTATNGAEALDILKDHNVDLLITDLEMPVMHGYELIHRIRTSQKWRDIPVVVLTSRSAEKHRIKALQSGVKDFIVKPFEEKAMLEILRKYLSLS